MKEKCVRIPSLTRNNFLHFSSFPPLHSFSFFLALIFLALLPVIIMPYR